MAKTNAHAGDSTDRQDVAPLGFDSNAPAIEYAVDATSMMAV
jgi:hypothetical protein